jgi:Flp pilus assembly protein TadB
MVAKWIAISIIVGLLAAMLPVVIVTLWTISKVFVSAVLLFALLIGFITLVTMVIDKNTQIKRLQEELEETLDEKEND